MLGGAAGGRERGGGGAGPAGAGFPGTGCPYAALWSPGSPLRLPEGHPALALHSLPADAAAISLRGLLDAGVGNASAAAAPAGAEGGPGYCETSNPFSGTRDCTQFLAGTSAEAARAACAAGVSMPGQAGEFSEGRCPQYSNPDFGGECMRTTDAGIEVTSVMTAQDGNPMGDCAMITTVCTTFIQGNWDPSAKCAAEAPAGGEEEPNCEGCEDPRECEMMPGVGGGAHISPFGYWSSICPLQESPYASPLVYRVDSERFFMESKHTERSRTWYDATINAKRMDNSQEDGFSLDQEGFDQTGEGEEEEGNPFSFDRFEAFENVTETTMFHIDNKFYWFAREGGECLMTMNSPVGILRPNWILDNKNTKSTRTQYLGKQYLEYEDGFSLVKQWRKIEPLEGAYMIVSFEDEPTWETPEGLRSRHIQRTTPGAPGAGDTIEYFYNHTTDFDAAEIFNFTKYDLSTCEGKEPDRSFGPPGADEGNSTEGEDGGRPDFSSLLNENPNLRVDESFVDVLYDGLPGAVPIVLLEAQVEAPPFKPVVRVPLQGGAVASKDPYLALNYTIDEEAGTFEIEVETNYTGGWVGVAFPETPCAMVPADAVIAEFGEDDEIVVGTFRLEDVLVSGTKPDPKQSLAGSSAGRTGDTLRMTFSRAFDNGGRERVDPSKDLVINWALGMGDKVSFHPHRGCVPLWTPEGVRATSVEALDGP